MPERDNFLTQFLACLVRQSLYDCMYDSTIVLTYHCVCWPLYISEAIDCPIWSALGILQRSDLDTVSFCQNYHSYPNFIYGLVCQTHNSYLYAVNIAFTTYTSTSVLICTWIWCYLWNIWSCRTTSFFGFHSYPALWILFLSDVRNFGKHCIVTNTLKFRWLRLLGDSGFQRFFFSIRGAPWPPFSLRKWSHNIQSKFHTNLTFFDA